MTHKVGLLGDSEARAMAKIYGNRWLVKRSLKEGGQSVVFIVEDRTSKLPGEYGLKRLKRKDRVARFRNEVAILRRMDDRNIIKLVHAQVQEDGSDDDSFLVMPVATHVAGCDDQDPGRTVVRLPWTHRR